MAKLNKRNNIQSSVQEKKSKKKIGFHLKLQSSTAGCAQKKMILDLALAV